MIENCFSAAGGSIDNRQSSIQMTNDYRPLPRISENEVKHESKGFGKEDMQQV